MRASEQLARSVLEVVTLETAWPQDLETYYADMREARELYPYGHGVLRASPWVGTFRGFQSLEERTELTSGGYPQGVIVQADSDPMDWHEGGEAMAQVLGHRLITVVDSGEHELYLLSGENRLLEMYVEDYLINGVLPSQDLYLPSPRTAPPVPLDSERVGV